MGMCVAGGAYLPVMCDHMLMTEGSGLFLAGPALVQAAIGQKSLAEELGGARMHSAISGTVDFREPNDETCTARIRSLVEKMGYRARSAPFHRAAPEAPLYPAEELYGIYRQRSRAPLRHAGGDCARRRRQRASTSTRPSMAQTLLCGYARIGGYAVGIVANQKLHVQQTDHQGNRRIEFGGVIYSGKRRQSRALHHGLQPERDSAGLPARRERLHGGARRRVERHHPLRGEDGERRRQFGGAENLGHHRRLVRRRALRHVRQGLRSALYLCLADGALRGDERRVRRPEPWWRSRSSNWNAQGRKLTEEDKQELFESVKQTYDRQMDPRYGAARLWLDKIIDPTDTREAIIQALEAASHNPDVPKFNVGILQT